ncbi:putative polyketide synthase [Hypoxylon sp. FL1150]|nr:putative polyketide synthase [Hypoxylon sp. FL1150]
MDSSGSQLENDQGNLSSKGHDDPICIVGMACRLPGSIRSLSHLWDFLLHRKSAQGRIPQERFDVKGYFDGQGKRFGVIESDGGYFIQEDVRQFENSFFGINNLEATYLDPQQRKLLEVVFECFENAGVSLEQISGSNTGVYVGNFTHDYYLMQLRDPDHIHRYHGTGTGTTLLANRVSHAFNLHGPSFTLDTACSSSIYGLHVAVSALKAGECDGAIVAGVNLILTPESQVAATKTGVLSPTSTCHTFDVSADGYGRAEGVNAVYLKRMSAALRDGDNIYAVIRGTAVNSNGRTPGITLPSADLQEAVVRKAYHTAGLDFIDTDYIECHGTGTAVGDPIEVDALGRCFSLQRTSPLMIGSVKTNLGHSEAASGLTSLIKVALSLHRGLVLPTRGVDQLNPKLELDERNMRVVTAAETWPRPLQRASINSFGYGGANAHVILESSLSYIGTKSGKEILNEDQDQLVLIPLSAETSRSLSVRQDQISQMIDIHGISGLGRLAYTLTRRRSHLGQRSYSIVNAKGSEIERGEWAITTKAKPLPIALVFTGQGAQYVGMAKELLGYNKVFSSTLRQLDQVLRNLPPNQAPNWSLEQTILDPYETSQVNQSSRSQPLCTAIQIALVDVIRSWGIQPSAAIGHSSGEIAAAYAAGLHSAAQAIITAYFRGYATNQLKVQGAMITVGIGPQVSQDVIEGLGLTGQLHVACINSPQSVTISGPPEPIKVLLQELQRQKIFAKVLETGGRAYHSPLMQEVGALYENLIAPYIDIDFDGAHPVLDMYSSVDVTNNRARVLDSTTKWSKYWRDNLEKPVQFASAMADLVADRALHLIEIGPHSSLKSSINQILVDVADADGRSTLYSPSLVRNQDANLSLKLLAGTLFLHGHTLDWESVNSLFDSHRYLPSHDIPSYPWDYSGELLWAEPRASVDLRNRRYPRHELLGSPQPAGDGIHWNWRNILRPREVIWILDHKVESQVVFPIAGYLAIAMEALSQILGLQSHSSPSHETPSFHFHEVSINAALVLPDNEGQESEAVELHTTMSLRKISKKSTSAYLYDFWISSWLAGLTVEHCAGSISLARGGSSGAKGTVMIRDTDGYRKLSMKQWYDKSMEEGLSFGPHLQSLTSLLADGDKLRSDVITTAYIEPPIRKTSTASYVIHPLTIDACLQSTILSAATGSLSKFRPYLPVFISECRINARNTTDTDEMATLHTQSRETGVSSLRAECTLRDSNGLPVVDMKGIRMALYTGKVVRTGNTSLQTQRHPVMRVYWKPDILSLSSNAESQLNQYVSAYQESRQLDLIDDESIIIEALIDLIGHKNPRMDVLQLGIESESRSQHWLRILGQGTAFPRYRTWQNRVLEEDGSVSLLDTPGAFSALTVDHPQAKMYWSRFPHRLTSLVRESGIIITPKTDEAMESLATAGFNILNIKHRIILARRVPETIALGGKHVLIVSHQPSSVVTNFISFLTSFLKDTMSASEAHGVSVQDLDSVELTAETVCISLVEIEREFLATMTQEEMDSMRRITGTVRDVLWLTSANMLANPNPNLTLAGGLSRALMMEQPSLRFLVMDIGSRETLESHMSTICINIGKVLGDVDGVGDKEFIYSEGLLYISRLGPDFEFNSLFRRRLLPQEPKQLAELSSVEPVRLSIGSVGMMDTLYFQQLDARQDPPEEFIDVEVKAVSLNAKDVYAMSGRVETRDGTLAHEFSGIVTAVGPAVKDFEPGDRVVVNAPNRFSTNERVPACSAQKLLPHEGFAETAVLPIAYCTALYALRDRANLQPGESVLIHSGAGAFGMAAITVARNVGAVVYATAGSSKRREFLVDGLGLPAAHVFSSRDDSFVDGLREKTGGRGVDVVVNSLVGDLMHASWAGCTADFGRFVEVGKRELTDSGKLDMSVFSRNVTFTAFDLTELFFSGHQSHRDTWVRLMKDVLKMFRSGLIQPAPITMFSAADIAKAYRYFSSRDRLGKVVVSFEDASVKIPYVPTKYRTSFSSNKVYLLVGCLGGLGRSLSSWMMTRGARKFIFLGRSGSEKQHAKELVARLEHAGAQVTVVRGDVCSATDVNTAMEACRATGAPVGGIVQAAMGLHEDLFSRMTSEGWHTSVRPKWTGTWNLHAALEDFDGAQALDFFLLTSSMTGTVGVATEANYCAANAFLDAFAYWRRAQGKPCVALGLGMVSEVGYLHENPRIQDLLLRRGLQPLDEDEFLQVVDLAISGNGCEPAMHPAAASHVLTGMETLGVRRLMDKGFQVTHAVMDDQRSSILAAALDAEALPGQAGEGSTDMSRRVDAAPWLKQVPQNMAESLLAEASAPSLRIAISRTIGKRFSNLILMPTSQIDFHKPFAQFGVDSMIASEFRTWFWNAFKVDVPFLDLLSPQKSLEAVAAYVEIKLLEARQPIKD